MIIHVDGLYVHRSGTSAGLNIDPAPVEEQEPVLHPNDCNGGN